MKKKIKISPMGLKGNEINERMKTLMGIGNINENTSKVVVELTKVGPDGNAYAIIRENHEWYIKTTDKKQGLVAEDFKYIGGLQNKKSEAYPSYAKAIKHLNLKFKSLAEACNFEGEINVFENDNLLTETGIAGFSNYAGNGFSNEGNLEGNAPLVSEEEDMDEDEDSEDVELTTEEAAVEAMKDKETKEEELPPNEKDYKEQPGYIHEHKLSILKALENMDAIIDSLTEGKVKKKVYTLK
jgi:hypothetical protein